MGLMPTSRGAPLLAATAALPCVPHTAPVAYALLPSRMSDPEASKPDDWDEDAPRQIEDPEDEKPEGWLDDEPEEIDDPGEHCTAARGRPEHLSSLVGRWGSGTAPQVLQQAQAPTQLFSQTSV